MRILDYKQAVALDDHNQTKQAVLLCYFIINAPMSKCLI